MVEKISKKKMIKFKIGDLVTTATKGQYYYAKRTNKQITVGVVKDIKNIDNYYKVEVYWFVRQNNNLFRNLETLETYFIYNNSNVLYHKYNFYKNAYKIPMPRK